LEGLIFFCINFFMAKRKSLLLDKFYTKLSKPSGVSAEDEKAGANAIPAHN